MKRYTAFIILSLAFSCTFAAAYDGEVKYTSFYPIPSAELKRIRLVPQPESKFGASPLLEETCMHPGRIFFNQDQNQLYICTKELPSDDNFFWTYSPGIWEQNGDTLSISSTNDELLIGMGTNPDLTFEKLTLAYDGGLLATGSFNSSHPTDSFNILTTSSTGTRFIWYPEKAALRAGGIKQGTVNLSDPALTYSARTTGDGPSPFTPDWADSHIGNYSVAFGINNESRAEYSGILGGEYSLIESGAGYSVILNSALNTAIQGNSDYSTSTGGNITDSQYTFAGGQSYYDNDSSSYKNTTLIDNSDYAAVLNSGTIIDSSHSFIGTALPNPNTSYNPADAISVTDLKDDFGAVISSDSCSSGYDTTHGTILAAYGIMNCSAHGFIGSGSQHRMHKSKAAVILGGKQNTIENGDYSVILGGENNTAGGNDVILDGDSAPTTIPGPYQFLGGGKGNRVHTSHSIVMGGENNEAGALLADGHHNTHAVVAGGLSNKAYGYASFIGGGSNNVIGTSSPLGGNSGSSSVILGGKNNRILDWFSVIGSGENNTTNGSHHSVIEGGSDNMIENSPYSWLFGENTTVDSSSDNSWVFAFNETISSQPNSFIISGNNMRVGIQTMSPQADLDVNGDAQAETLIISSTNNVSGDALKIHRRHGSGNSGQIGRRDLAEIFPASQEVAPGDVLVLDRKSTAVILTKSRKPYDPMLVGVVSTAPAMVFQDGMIISDFSYTAPSTSRPPVALAGQVPCKVSLENGDIQYGDLLTTSSTPGHAMKAANRSKAFGAVIGKALEPFNKETAKGAETGVITILVSLQ